MTRRALVAVIGDAGAIEGTLAYETACRVGTLAVDAGFRVVTGGLGGVMEAACRGAHASSVYREGDTLGLLPHADPGEANPWVDIVVATSFDFARNLLVANSDAVIAVGGGAGTLSEIAFAWIYKRLIVALTIEGWSGELAGRALDRRQRQPNIEDDQVHAAATAEEAIEIVRARLPAHRARHPGFRGRRE